MIVQPDWLRHWKTLKLVKMTGDPAAPLALIRLWSHCQTSRKWEFPELKRDDLAAICEWNSENISKLSCEKALTDCRWIEKLPGGGYRVHAWEEHNKNLIVNWNRNPSGKPKSDSDSDPAGTPRAPHGEPDRPNQTKSDRPNQPKPNAAAPVPSPSGSSGASGKDSLKSNSGDGRTGLDGVGELVKRAIPFATPSLDQVRNCLRMAFDGAERYAEAFMHTMEKQSWRDNGGSPLTCWQSVAKAYASKCALNHNKGNDRNAGTYNEGADIEALKRKVRRVANVRSA